MAPPKHKQIRESVRDSLGRTVILEEERWQHIVEDDGHPEMDGYELAVMRVVENADKRVTGNYATAEKLCSANVGPSRWLVVVVEYHGLQGRVITAYPTSKEPRSKA